MSYDLIVIGAGPGGFSAAMRSAQLGLKTLLIEKGEVGGLCLNRGCIPSKSLILDVFALGKMNRSEPTASFRQMHQKKNEIIVKLRKNMEALLQRRGVDWVKGEVELTSISEKEGSYTVTVQDDTTPYRAPHLVVATGTAPKRRLGEMETDGRTILTSDDLIHREEIPKSLVVIGGGAVGCEFANLYAEIGCQVTLLEMEETLLPSFDRDICRELERALLRRGIAVKTSRKVVGIASKGNGGEVTGLGPEGLREVYRAEKVLLSVGRDPSGFAPEFILQKDRKRDLATDARHFLSVDPSFQTNWAGVYGVGDVNGKWLLAHAASYEGILAAETVAGRTRLLDQAIPDCVYTHPEVAKVGLTEEEAVSRGGTVHIGRSFFGANAKALLLEEPTGFVKLVGDGSTGQLLGAHLIGPGVSELLAELALALRLKATARDLAGTIHPHPTLSEAVCEAALDFYGESIYRRSS